MRLSDKKKPALVLSGGGVKAAAFHIGVCLALQEKGFKFAGGSPVKVANEFPEDKMTFKTYVGSSAGSVISTFLASGYDIDSIIHAFTQGTGLPSVTKTKRKTELRENHLKPITYRNIFGLNLTAGHPSRFLSGLFKKKPVISGGLEVLLKRGFKVNGLFSTRSLERYMRENACLNNKFSSLGVELYIVATQLNHSRKVIFGNFDQTTKDERIKYAGYASISEAVAASASLPPFFAPYGIHNHKGREVYFFDGEIRDTLSTHVAADHGSDLVIASYSIHPYHFNEEIGSLHEYGIPIIFNQALYQVVQQKIDTHIRHQREVRSMIKAVDGYLKQANIAEEHREKLLDILNERTQNKPEVDYIYIHPSPQDYEMFFADHFSLNPKILGKIVQTGFKSAMRTLRKHSL
ncbi:MAG: patatin-like phospholipase family protein [Bdellovibrionales bacterium]|nr:patatin-like phospholipase family protein [Bdellovibrionales bacterium]